MQKISVRSCIVNLPNKLTVLRLILAPLFFIAFFLPSWFGSGGNSSLSVISGWLLLILFVLIELSDLLDGIIARRWNLMTDLGKVLDPFADVISRITYFICLAYASIMPLWIFLIILYREFLVTFLRMVLMGEGTAMAANVWGKFKAVLYAVSAIAGIILVVITRVMPGLSWADMYAAVLQWVFGVTAAVSLLSFIIYFMTSLRNGKFSGITR